MSPVLVALKAKILVLEAELEQLRGSFSARAADQRTNLRGRIYSLQAQALDLYKEEELERPTV